MNNPPVDDRTAEYILETRKCFEDLRQAASQIAGVLVLAASGAKSAVPDHPMLKAATELYREAFDHIRSVRPTERARPHHDFMVRAANALAAALAAIPRMDIDAILRMVRIAYSHLQHASETLPGFEMVAFEHGCCAVHSTK